MISAIVPARNEEATIAAAVESLAAQPEIKEIIVINDQSTDGTAAKLKELSARFPQLRVLETQELPNGWVGKNYAVSLGAAQATGDWLLFTDADGVHLPGSTAHALADAADSGRGTGVVFTGAGNAYVVGKLLDSIRLYAAGAEIFLRCGE